MQKKPTPAERPTCYASRNMKGELCLFTKYGLAFSVVPSHSTPEQHSKELGYELMYQFGTPLRK